MSLQSWLQNMRSALAPRRGRHHQTRRDSLRAARHRPTLEVLEDRCVPAFLAPIDYAAGASPNAVVTADFNGDGHLDLATANQGSNSVSVLLGNGDGTFQTARIFATSGSPLWIEAADFNGDGKLDLVTGNVGGDPGFRDEIGTLLGNGDGSFQWIGSTWAGNQEGLRDAAVGDFNGDGKLDVAMSIYDVPFDAPSSGVEVWLGDGNGFFAYNGGLPASGSNYLYIVAADFNRDGYTDLAYADPWADAVGGVEVSLSLGAGYGDFDLPQSYALGLGGDSLAVADLNGDGNPDLVTDGAVLQGNGDGTFQVTQDYHGMVGDFNGDGSLDLLAGNNLLSGSGHDAGTFPAASGASTLGDFNGDARWDMVSTNYSANSVSVRLNDGNWTPLPPSLGINDAIVTEGNTGTVAATFTVSLLAASTDTITVAYATGDGSATAGSDYQAASGTLTFAPGETSKAVTVLVNGDRIGEPNEVFVVNLSSPTNAVIADGLGVGTIVDDEPRIAITPSVSRTEGNTGQTPFAFTVFLSSAYDAPVTVDWATADGTATAGSDYQAATGTLTFAPGETSKTVTVLVNGDRVAESNETFVVNLSSPTNAVIAAGQGLGTIMDDEPRIAITPSVSRSEGNTGQTPFAFAVTLSSAYDAPVTVDWATTAGSATAGSDYQSGSGTLTFAPGETTKTITILVNGDRLPEPNETFVVNLGGATSAIITQGNSVGTIVDNEPRMSITDVTKSEGRKNHTTLFTFTVTLSVAYDQPVTVSYRTANGTATTGDGDYVGQAGTLTFAPGETTKTITIVVNGDSKKEADEYFYLDLFGNSSNSLFAKNRGVGTILNDD